MLQEANGSKRQELLQHANADQINVVSELVLNVLKNKIPVTPPMLAKLQPYKRYYVIWDVVDIPSKSVVSG